MEILNLVAGIVCAAITAWFTPFGKFQVAKRRARHDYRRKLINDSRAYISSLLKSEEPETLFLDDHQYLALRPYLDAFSREQIEGNQTKIQSENKVMHGIMKSQRLLELSKEIDRLEITWKLV